MKAIKFSTPILNLNIRNLKCYPKKCRLVYGNAYLLLMHLVSIICDYVYKKNFIKRDN